MCNSFTRPQPSSSTSIKTVTSAPDAAGLCGFAIIGLDNPADQRMAYDVGGGEGNMSNPLHSFENGNGFGEPGGGAGRQISLGRIARHHHAASLSKPGQEHLHLLRRGVLCFVENDEGA